MQGLDVSGFGQMLFPQSESNKALAGGKRLVKSFAKALQGKASLTARLFLAEA